MWYNKDNPRGEQQVGSQIKKACQKAKRASGLKNLKGIDTMTNSKKMTKREYFNALLSLDEVKANNELVDFINHELELLSKKNASEKKLTPTQKENLAIQDAILNYMEADVLYTITDLLKNVPECAGMSNQRVSAIVRIMREEKKVERIEEKRKAYFRKAMIEVEG